MPDAPHTPAHSARTIIPQPAPGASPPRTTNGTTTGNPPQEPHGGGARVGEARGGQAEGLLEEAQIPAGPEGQAQLDKLVELEPAPGGRPGVRTAARSALPSPSWKPPGWPPWPLSEVPSMSHHIQAEWVGATHWAQAQRAQTSESRPARQQPGHSQAHPRPIFSLTLPPKHTEPPQVQNKRPNSPRAQAKTGLPRQAGLQARPPAESRDPVISGRPENMLYFWVPRALMLPRCPSSGLQALPGPQELPGEQSGRPAIILLPPTHPQANGPQAARGPGLKTSRPDSALQLHQPDCCQHRPFSTGTGAGQPWAAGAAVDRVLGPRSVPGGLSLPCPHAEARQLGDSGQVIARTATPQAVGAGRTRPSARGPKVDRQPLRGNAACPTAPGLPWAASRTWTGQAASDTHPRGIRPC